MVQKIEMHSVGRRELLKLGGTGALALVSTSLLPSLAQADAKMVAAAIKKLIGDKPTKDGKITFELPQIAENGNTVPIEVGAEGATAIMVLAAGNPVPPVATFNFGPLAGATRAKTRIRLATSQDVIAVAKLADGSFAKATKAVKVTIGGCGG